MSMIRIHLLEGMKDPQNMTDIRLFQMVSSKVEFDNFKTKILKIRRPVSVSSDY